MACRPLACAAHSDSRSRSPVLSTIGTRTLSAMRTAYGQKLFSTHPTDLDAKGGQGPRDEVAKAQATGALPPKPTGPRPGDGGTGPQATGGFQGGRSPRPALLGAAAGVDLLAA